MNILQTILKASVEVYEIDKAFRVTMVNGQKALIRWYLDGSWTPCYDVYINDVRIVYRAVLMVKDREVLADLRDSAMRQRHDEQEIATAKSWKIMEGLGYEA